MKFLEAASLGNRIRRDCWPEYDYLQLNKESSIEGAVCYWNNDTFQWVDIRLQITDLLATDWTEDKNQ